MTASAQQARHALKKPEPGTVWKSDDGPWRLHDRAGSSPSWLNDARLVGSDDLLSSRGLIVAVIEVVPGSATAGTHVLILDARTGRFGWIRHRRFRA